MAYVNAQSLPLCNTGSLATVAVAGPTLAGLPLCNTTTAAVPVAAQGQVAVASPVAYQTYDYGNLAQYGVQYAQQYAPQYADYAYAGGQVSAEIPAAQLAAPLSTAHFNYNAVAKARTVAAAAKAAYVNAAAAADAANRASAAAGSRYKAAKEDAENKAAKLQRDLDDAHIAHSRIARQATYPCLG